ASEKCPNKFDYSNKNEKLDGYINFLQHQGICPEGWHVMNSDIWALLSETSSRSVALYMGSKVAGFGSNNYGLSILPAGYWNPVALEYGYISNSALYWLPQQYPEYDDCSYRVSVRTDEFNRTFRGIKTQGFSIRCVKNY
ncbi:major paralogous domain-containing protein, partial [Fibrobacter sp. UWH9]|uniref:fibrobacter succinogenes major paralogous domain-containing protein n=1 Tax=Fibrobacter sp. UWH9 TaxID=1896213 RepID=UPI000919127F